MDVPLYLFISLWGFWIYDKLKENKCGAWIRLVASLVCIFIFQFIHTMFAG